MKIHVYSLELPLCHHNCLFWGISNEFTQHTIITQSIGMSYLLTILVLKFEVVNYATSLCSKLFVYVWQTVYCGVWSGSTLFAKACLSQYLELVWYHCFVDQKEMSKLFPFAFWPGERINHLWLELPMSRTNFHDPKDVRAVEVWLYL